MEADDSLWRPLKGTAERKRRSHKLHICILRCVENEEGSALVICCRNRELLGFYFI